MDLYDTELNGRKEKKIDGLWLVEEKGHLRIDRDVWEPQSHMKEMDGMRKGE